MKNNIIRNFALMLAVLLAFSSCASTRVAKDPHAPYLGEWDYQVLELPMDIDGTFVISKEEGILNATMISPMGETVIEGISIEANVFKADFEAEGNLIELEGTFEGDSYSGFFLVQDNEFPMKMKKKQLH